MMMTLVIFGLLAVAVAWLDEQHLQHTHAMARVLDGDSLELEGEQFRLAGIDAPEFKQNCQFQGKSWPCGREARRALLTMVGGRMVQCMASGVDRYQRWLATCETDQGVLNARMVLQGWAVDFGGYAKEEAEAKAGRKGIWRGEFDLPQDWRRHHGGQDVGNPENRTSSPGQWMQSLPLKIRSWWRSL